MEATCIDLVKGIQRMGDLVRTGRFMKIDDDVNISKEDIHEWQAESQHEVDTAMRGIKFLFNKKLGKPVKDLLNEK